MDTAHHKPFRLHAFINSRFGSKLSITLTLEETRLSREFHGSAEKKSTPSESK
jgi:hypothetical protein